MIPTQEKTGKIIVRQKKKKSRLMTEGYKGLGVASLPLHDIATTYQSVEQRLELQQCSVTGAMIEFVIIPKIIGETDAMFDDTMSCQSGRFLTHSILHYCPPTTEHYLHRQLHSLLCFILPTMMLTTTVCPSVVWYRFLGQLDVRSG